MGFMFCDLHVSLKYLFVGGYKFVEFVLLKVKTQVSLCSPLLSLETPNDVRSVA